MSKSIRMFIPFVLMFVICIFTTGAMAKGFANVTLSVDKQTFLSNESVNVTVTISNPGRGAIRILKWYTPVEDVEEPLFAVVRDSTPAEFIGPRYKRPEPTERDFVILKSGESITRTVDLASFYDLSGTGIYAVTYRALAPDVYGKRNPAIELVQELKSNSLELWIDGRPAKVPTAEPPTAVSGSNAYVKCSSTQQPLVATARTEAANYSQDAWNYVLGNNQGPRYTTWFGTYSSSRYSTVTNHFASITNVMDTQQMTFNCGCHKNYYAYVYPNQPYNIYLCKVFWNAPMTGTDSKAGTLIHETSHFTVVAGTDDWVYGQSGAKNLAISDPNKAIDNADSHEYFSENTPFQP